MMYDELKWGRIYAKILYSRLQYLTIYPMMIATIVIIVMIGYYSYDCSPEPESDAHRMRLAIAAKKESTGESIPKKN
jgi:hypothetical protein